MTCRGSRSLLGAFAWSCAAICAGAHPAHGQASETAMQREEHIEVPFEIVGGYSFAEAFEMGSPDGSVLATAGRLTGSWRFTFDGDRLPSGPAHLDAATLFRSTPEGQDLSGIMRFAMHEITGEAEGSAWLYLRYGATSTDIDGTKVTFVVEGDFVGGTGIYERASGSLRVTSVNGSDTGGGTLRLAPETSGGSR